MIKYMAVAVAVAVVVAVAVSGAGAVAMAVPVAGLTKMISWTNFSMTTLNKSMTE